MYKITCKECEKFGLKAHYFGEISIQNTCQGATQGQESRVQNGGLANIQKTNCKTSYGIHPYYKIKI